MGSYYIWIAASVAYGLLSGAIYTALRGRKEPERRFSLRRFLVSSAIYALVALMICRVLWVIFSD